MLLFGDTFQGTVDRTGGFANGRPSGMVNNSAVAIDRTCLTALKGKKDGGEFIPGEPIGQHYWPIGAVASGSKMWVFSMQRVKYAGGLGFRLTGTRVSTYTVPTNGNPILGGTYRRAGDSPFDGTGNQTDIMWPASVVSSGGYVYLYGSKPRAGASGNSVYLSRVPINRMLTAGAWRYWSDGKWTATPSAATALIDAGSGPEGAFDLRAMGGGCVITSRTGAFGSSGTLSQWVAPANWSRNNLDGQVLMRNANYYMVRLAEGESARDAPHRHRVAAAAAAAPADHKSRRGDRGAAARPGPATSVNRHLGP